MRYQDPSASSQSNGFIVAMPPQAARRQLQVSIVVAAAFIVATVLVLATGIATPRVERPATVKLTIELPGAAKIHHAAKASALRGI